MSVLAQPEQHQIEFIYSGEVAGIAVCRGFCAQLGGNDVNLFRGMAT